MRRIKILFYWLFINKNNVGLGELLSFMVKPTIEGIANKHISSIEKGEDYKVSFAGMKDPLFWPASFSIPRLYQVIAETFDANDWHYYQKKHTEIEEGDVLLDIGAAEGLFSLTVVNKCSHIYMVEPGEAFNKSLQKTFLPYSDKVTVYNVATGNEDGEIFFSEDSLDGKISDGTESNATKVDIRKVDTLLGKNKITYLKADIEGFELEMLKGAEKVIKAHKPKIAITTYHDQNNPQEIISLIKSYVPEYNYYVKGIYEVTPKPVLIHFWV